MKPSRPEQTRWLTALPADLVAGTVVFLVALPLCLGIATASGAPPMSGVIAGIIGGLVVGILSRSHTSVSGPAAGLTAVVASQITQLGDFEIFLCAVVVAGMIQFLLGLARAGFIAKFFPSSVINGLLSAIGVILILKQIPHVFGHDTDPEGEMEFLQTDHENTFSEIFEIFNDISSGNFHLGPAVIGILCLLVIILWDKLSKLKTSPVPVAVVVVALGVALDALFDSFGGTWTVEPSHQVNIPTGQFFQFPAWEAFTKYDIYFAGFVIAIVASLETLLNIEAVDRIDPHQRDTPPSFELIAQGLGNIVCGLLGGLPITSVIVRSSVNINAGGRTKFSAIFHGILLSLCVYFFAFMLNRIPLSALAAILIVTGYKLIAPSKIRAMWTGGSVQFIPFVITVFAIVFTDLIIGIAIGLVVSIFFILRSNLRRPLRTIIEKHASGNVTRIELASQISFLNKATFNQLLSTFPSGAHILLDARHTEFIDPDILEMIHDFKNGYAPQHEIKVSLLGFRSKYQFQDDIQFVEFSSRDLQEKMTPHDVLQVLLDGHERFVSGKLLTRNFNRQKDGTAAAQYPMAAILSCIDSRAPSEIIFDLGLGDVFSIRIAGNIISERVLGSLEYSCQVAGAKLIVVMGHTRCGAVNAAMKLLARGQTAIQMTGCQHLASIAEDIQAIVDSQTRHQLSNLSDEQLITLSDQIAEKNVLKVMDSILDQSHSINALIQQGRIVIVGFLYDVTSGELRVLHQIGIHHHTPQPDQSNQTQTP